MLHEDIKGRQINVMGRTTTLLLLLLLLGQTFLLSAGSALEISAPSSQKAELGTIIKIPCTVKMDSPINLRYLAIVWKFQDKVIARYDNKGLNTQPRHNISEENIAKGAADLYITNASISDIGTYRCTVTYTPETTHKDVDLTVYAVPEVSIQKTAIQSGMKSLLQCSITNFFPKDMKVTWLKNCQILSGSVTQDDRMNADNTFTRISSVNVTFLKEQGNPKITCQVEHKYLQDPIKDFYIVQYRAAPNVNIKASKTTDGNDQIYMCQATDYFPEEVTMDWLLDGKRIDFTQQSNNQYFNKEIYYRIQLEGENPPSQISCEVHHETLQSPIKLTEEVKVERDCKRSCHFGIIGVLVLLLVTAPPALWYFMKREFQWFQVGHIHSLETEGKVTMYCMASNCPEDVQVTWTITENGKEHEISENKQEKDEEAGLLNNQVSQDYTVETNRSQSDNLHHAISTLSFTPAVLKHQEIMVSCTFLCNGKRRQKQLSWKYTNRKPEVSGPMQLSLGDNGDVICSVSLQNFFPKDVKIKWSHGLGHFQDVETLNETFTKIGAYTFNVRSECRLPGNLLKDQGYRIRATWNHDNESGQLEASITDSEWRPMIGEIEKPTFTDGKEAKLLCRVSGYFPDVLDVKWLRRDAESQEFYVVSASDKYKIPIVEATQQEDKTFTYTACLSLSVSAATDYGAEYMCRVKHPSVTTHLEKRTGEIRVIGEFYLIENENKKTPLAQMSEQQHGKNINAENQEPAGIQTVNVTLLKKDKIRAEVSYLTPKDIKISWMRQTTILKNYVHSKLTIESNSDGTYTAYSEITLKHKSGKYIVVVEHQASKTTVTKTVLQEQGEWYLIDNQDRKTPLAQASEQQRG